MISASERSWNSPTTLYLARRLAEIASGRRIAVLDVGCGDGTTIEHLAGYGYDLYGYELAPGGDAPRERLATCFGAAVHDRIRTTESEREIPFADRSFDVVYASQVFEHVKFLDQMLAECARVLRPGGTLLANFPLATYPIEWHLKIPFAHWIPPGPVRVAYFRLFYAAGIRPRFPGATALDTARSQDAFLRDRTYYRFVNEVTAVARHHFRTCEIETGRFVQAKLDLLSESPSPGARLAGALVGRLRGPTLDALTTYLFNAAFCMHDPRR